MGSFMYKSGQNSIVTVKHPSPSLNSYGQPAFVWPLFFSSFSLKWWEKRVMLGCFWKRFSSSPVGRDVFSVPDAVYMLVTEKCYHHFITIKGFIGCWAWRNRQMEDIRHLDDSATAKLTNPGTAYVQVSSHEIRNAPTLQTTAGEGGLFLMAVNFLIGTKTP